MQESELSLLSWYIFHIVISLPLPSYHINLLV